MAAIVPPKFGMVALGGASRRLYAGECLCLWWNGPVPVSWRLDFQYRALPTKREAKEKNQKETMIIKSILETGVEMSKGGTKGSLDILPSVDELVDLVKLQPTGLWEDGDKWWLLKVHLWNWSDWIQLFLTCFQPTTARKTEPLCREKNWYNSYKIRGCAYCSLYVIRLWD